MKTWLGAVAIAMVLSTAVLTGCGDDAPPAKAAEDVQATLVGVANAIDQCVKRTNDARKCTNSRQVVGVPAGVSFGDEPGEVNVRATKALRYQLSAVAADGTTYALLAQPVGARKRVCKPAGTASCPKGGVW